jgi:superfamily II DNA or RNA helicase
VSDYGEFIATKSRSVAFDACPRAGDLAPHLFPHQRAIVDWALRRGRCAVFSDTGTGKTAMQIEWARNVSTAGRVLILAPLAVAEQTVREAARFGVHVEYARAANETDSRIVITNYDMLDHFTDEAWVGVILDESSILKAYDGKTRTAIIEAFGAAPFRLACTATPAPNDHTELGNHAEFLGIRSRVEMLAEYFCHDGGDTATWRLKGHAVDLFWRWVCTWAVTLKKPSDIGFDDKGYDLPPLTMKEHVVSVDDNLAQKAGLLFAPDANTLSEQRATRRMTMERRAEKASELAAIDGPVLIWCELNDEADEIERRIPGAVQVRGSDDRETKRERLLGFSEGRYRVLVSKPSICGFGLNWQHCATVIFAGASHSYEQTYQAIRRCWRFGQAKPVTVHVIRAETESAIVANFRRKEADAERMSREMVERMRETMAAAVGVSARQTNAYNPQVQMTVPVWVGKDVS